MDQPLARRLYDQAQLLAAGSGNAELQAHVLANMSMQSTYLGELHRHKGEVRQGLRLAQLAADTARHEPSPRLHALIALRHAAAYARLGDTTAFRASITQARNQLDRGTHPADPAWIGFVTLGEISACEAQGHLQLGSADRALELHRHSLEDPALSPRNRACAQGSLAGVLLKAGDHREAITVGLSILPGLANGRMTSARALERLRPVRMVAEKSGAEEFCVRFDEAARSLTV